MQTLGLLGYQLMYIQVPFLLAPLPERDLLRFAWPDLGPSIGLYSYKDSVIGQFKNQEYWTRSLIGEDDLFLLSGGVVSVDTPYSFIRMVNGDYKFLHFCFERNMEGGEVSGGMWGVHTFAGGLKGYGNLSIPFKLKGFNPRFSLSTYSNIWSVSLNTRYFYIGTTRNKWLGYLKIGDLRFGSTADKQFASYLFRPYDPLFLVMVNAEGEGLFGDKELRLKELKLDDWFIAPIYVLSLKSSIYFIISKNPAMGFKSEYGDVEIGRKSYLSLKTDFLSAFITYSLDDSLPRGGIESKISYSFYGNRITPGITVSFHGGKLDSELNLRILEAKLFWGIKDLPYWNQYWGLNVEFSF